MLPWDLRSVAASLLLICGGRHQPGRLDCLRPELRGQAPETRFRVRHRGLIPGPDLASYPLSQVPDEAARRPGSISERDWRTSADGWPRYPTVLEAVLRQVGVAPGIATGD